MDQQQEENDVIVVVLMSYMFDFERKTVPLLSFQVVQKPSLVAVEQVPKLSKCFHASISKITHS